MKQTPLHEEHLKLGGKIVDFAGWELPVLYTSIIEEHLATRNDAGLFDISHMGEFRITGSDAASLLERSIPTRLSKLEKGKAMYSCLPTESGGLIDDLFIYMVSDEEYFIVVNASNSDRDFQLFSDNAEGLDVTIENLSDEVAKIDLQGPKSLDILRKVIDDRRLPDLERFFFFDMEYGASSLRISNTGYTGESGYELYVEKDAAAELWRAIIEAGEPLGLKPCGLGARDSLRIESCYSLYGHELSEEISPVEAGLRWIISSKEDYPGKAILEKQKTEGTDREMICIEMTGKGIPREGYRLEKDGTDIGYITSGVFSPLFKKGIAMALVSSGTAAEGDELQVAIRNKKVAAKVVPRPFYRYAG